jgi:carboxypeptidase C (cathepsin A)
MMIRRTATILAGSLLLATGADAEHREPVPVVTGPLLGPTVTEHRIAIGGQTIPYRATFREYALNSGEGQPVATISATAYVRTDVQGEGRPVLFLFNGGPGASSSPLHFSAFGPRLKPPGRSNDVPFSDNPDSLLDVADLVFIDPPGTGFSRLLASEGGKFFAPTADAAAVTQLIRDWLKENRRTGAPVFIGGESYGGFRLATMMRQAEALNIKGLLLISPATSLASQAGAETGDNVYVFRLPTMAVTAAYHGLAGGKGRAPEQVYEESSAFAERDYLVALHQGSALPAPEKRRIADRMAGFIGLPAQAILDADLRIGEDYYVENLLKVRHLLLGRLDTRVTAPAVVRTDRPAALNDPSLGLGASNVIRSPAITHYMADELNVRPGRDYVSLSIDVNFSWDWAEQTDNRILYFNPLPNIAAAMAHHPDLRLMVVGGLYDLVVPIAGARYAIRHAKIPLDRVRFLAIPAGHSAFEAPEVRAKFVGPIREFVRAGAR